MIDYGTHTINYLFEHTIITGLLQNTAILLSLSLLYGSVWLRYEPLRRLSGKILVGIVIGLIAVLLMQTPWTLVPGIVFDTRSVLLSISGLFFGGLPTAIAILIAGLMRLFIGGDGLWMGMAVIFTSGAIGVLWKKYQPLKQNSNKPADFLLLGLIVHLVMLGSTVLLPAESAIPTLKVIALPLLLVYTPATMLLGVLLKSQKINYDNRFATKQLRENEEKFRNLFENHSAVKFIIDPLTGDIVDANHAATIFYGWSKDELTTMNIGDINTLKHEELFQEIQNVLQNTKNYFEFKHKRKDGTLIDVETFSSTIDIAGKKYLHSIIHDVSEKKQLTKDLIIAKEKAEESDKLKTTFLMNMSHEIRTPLNGILGFASILIDGTHDTEKVVEYARIIRKSGQRLHSLINDMIDISRIESGVEKVNFEDINAEGTLYEALQQFSAQAQLKGLSLVTNFPQNASSVFIRTDGRKLHQIITNLINNAIKYSENGTIEVGFRIESECNKIIFYVKDEGIGIDKNLHSQVFKRFFQAENTITAQNPGTGLGLAICKGLTKLLGGEIWLESDKGKGSVFYLSLPLSDN